MTRRNKNLNFHITFKIEFVIKIISTKTLGSYVFTSEFHKTFKEKQHQRQNLETIKKE